MNLVADGHRVVVHDADPRRCGALVVAGAAVAANPAEVAAESAITFTSLPGPAAMEAVAGQWLEGAPRGSAQRRRRRRAEPPARVHDGRRSRDLRALPAALADARPRDVPPRPA